MTDLEIVKSLSKDIVENGGRAFLVGGFARDTILRQMGKDVISKDIDVEVFGLDMEVLFKLLQNYGTVNTVGKNFGVIKLNNTAIDISIPRRDSKIGVSHKDFIVNFDPALTLNEAARRRDFTINSIYIDAITGDVIDEYNGIPDLREGILRVTDPILFADDPLRVLRAMQLAGRFNLSLSDTTLALCKKMDLSSLPAERIGEEWKKLLLKSARPSIGIEVALSIGVLNKLHPQLAALSTSQTDSKLHPKVTIWEHAKLAIDEASKIKLRDKLNDEKSLEFMLAVLCHDIGKVSTTRMQNSSIASYGHEQRGAELTVKFLNQLAMSNYYLDVVPRLVAEHIFPIHNMQLDDAALRRLAQKLYLATIAQLARVAEADILGRTSKDKTINHLLHLTERAKSLNIADDKPSPIIYGRDLIPLGIKPGVAMGKVLNNLFEKQLSGDFTEHEEGLLLAKQLIDEMKDYDLA